MTQSRNNNLLINKIITDGNMTTYELKILDLFSEEITLVYIASESRYTDNGYTIYNLKRLRTLEGKGGITQNLYKRIEQIAQKFGISFIENELTVLRGNDNLHTPHYELANLLNCIVSINSLIRFTNALDK